MFNLHFEPREIIYHNSFIQAYSYGTGECTVLAFPSFPHSGASYELLWREVRSHKIRLISFDLPGWIGRSDNIFRTEPFSLDAYVEIARAVLEAFGVKQCGILGYSFGGNLTLRFVEKYPEMVDKIVLVSAMVDGHSVQHTRIQMLARIYNRLRLGFLMKKILMQEINKYNHRLADDVNADYLNYYADMACHCNGSILTKSVASLFTADLADKVHLLQSKKVMILNSKDETPYFRREAGYLRHELKGEKSLFMHGTHQDFMLRPDPEVVSKVVNFFTA